MKVIPLLLLAAAGGAIFVVLEHKASAASPSVWPPGFTPPGTSTTTQLPAASNPTGLPLKVTKWQQAADAGGTQAGTWSLYQNQNNQANDWAVFFNASPVQAGTTANSGLIAQAVVGLAG